MLARPLIPRRKLFDNPTFFNAKLSPDGRLLSWLAPVDGVLNVWVSPVDSIAAGQPVTRTKGRPINWQDWSPDGRYIMFLNDENGDENLHLFVVDPRNSELRDLTPFANIRAMPTYWSHVTPDEIAISLNDRDPRWHDVFRLDLATGQRSLIWENRQEFDFVGLDWQLRPRHARSNASDGGSRLWRLDGEKSTHWRHVPFDANSTTRVWTFDASGKHLHMCSSIEQDKSALVQIDWSTGEQKVMFESQRADVTGAIFDARRFEPEAVCVDAARQEWTALTPAVAPELALIKARLPGHAFHVQSQTDDGRRWIVMSFTAEQPATYHLLDRDKQTLTELFTARPELKQYRLARMHAVEGKSRDGLTLVSYFTLPADVEGDRPTRRCRWSSSCMVVHGTGISSATVAIISG